jgi:DNA-binding LacI/PurR family transcriptional regulator
MVAAHSIMGVNHMSITRVAKLAGVSSSTVSRVINNHPRVAPETAEAVRKAMEKLNYTPSDRRPGPKPSLRTRTGAANIAFLVLAPPATARRRRSRGSCMASRSRRTSMT